MTPSWRWTTFDALQDRNFRWLWVGQLASSATFRMESVACMVTDNTLLQANSHDRLRGRVMSVYMMMWGLMSLGTLPTGAIADRVRVPFVVSLEGGVLALIFLGVGWLWPRMRRLE